VAGETVPVEEEVVLRKPFCDLLRFKRRSTLAQARNDPKVLILAPMSGHFATLLRGTVEAMLPEHDVYITDWVDARNVPVSDGRFDLDDYIDYIESFCALPRRRWRAPGGDGRLPARRAGPCGHRADGGAQRALRARPRWC
jgi:poly(3-hydroxybutyrate) depolymerase